MPRASDRSASARDTWLVALTLLLSIAAIFLPAPAADALAAGMRRTLLMPVIWLQQDAVASRQTRKAFAKVVSERDSAVLAAQLLQSLKAENADLRGLLGLSRRLGREFRSAEVLHQQVPTDGRTILLGAGAADGLREFDPVLAAGGLVGTIRSVSPRTSIALTWAHPDWRASATTLDGTAYGLVGASPGSLGSSVGLEFRAISYRDTIPMGTLVVSSGLGGAYPQGIPIGTIVAVSREQQGIERVYTLRPAANPSALTHALVILGGSATPLAVAFPRPAAVVPQEPRKDSVRVAAPRSDSGRRSDSGQRVDSTRILRPRLNDSTPPPAASEPLPTLPDSL